MIGEERPDAKWLVRGLVCGPRLPTGSLKLDQRCSLKRLTESAYRLHIQRATSLLEGQNREFWLTQFRDPKVFHFTLPLAHQVESRHELTITVTARNPPLAALQAAKDADEYLGALRVAAGSQGYVFAPTTVKKLPDAHGVHTEEVVTSGLAKATVYEDEVLERSYEDYAKRLLELSGEDETLGTAFGYLRAAWRLDELPLDDAAIHKAVIANCFLVLETISDAVTKDWRKQNKDKRLSDQSEIVDELSRKLQHVKSPAKRVSAVRDAKKELDRVDRVFQGLELETAEHTLGIDERYILLAQQLNKFRNTELTHPGSDQVQDLLRWHGYAEDAALAYFEAYVFHIDSG